MLQTNNVSVECVLFVAGSMPGICKRSAIAGAAPAKVPYAEKRDDNGDN